MRKKKINKLLPDASPLDAKRFEQFQKEVFDINSIEGASSVENQVFSRNLKSICYIALIVLLTNGFWLAMDIYRGGTMGLRSGAALAVIIVQMLFSCYMLALPSLSKNKSVKLVRYSFLSYYICLMVDVTVLIVTKNIQMLAAGTNYSLAGISLSTCYLFIFALAPLPSKRDSLILGGVFLVSLLVPAFMPGHELYSLPQQCVIRVCIVAAYLYTRDVNLDLADSIRRLMVLSFTDSLTGTFNRRALDTYWDSICDSGRADSIGVLIFDIDEFKKYNDCYTHARGNDVLSGVCRAAQSTLEGEADFLFRYGGEEFVALLLNCTDEELLQCAKRINEAVYNADIARDDGGVFDRITVTVGCAREVALKAGCKNYIVHADEQLYIGKNNGRNCTVYKGEIYKGLP